MPTTDANEAVAFAAVDVHLTCAMFQQKWCDLVLGDTITQVATQCLEHGNLLTKVRSGFAAMFGELKGVIGLLATTAASSITARDALQKAVLAEQDRMAVRCVQGCV